MPIRILAVGDVVGTPGRRAVHAALPGLIADRKIDLVIVNGENIAGGSGITPNLVRKLLSYGAHVVTLGDHAFRKGDVVPMLVASDRLLRPANLSPKAAGKGATVVTTAGGVRVGVGVLLGRIFMSQLPPSDPFAAADAMLAAWDADGVAVRVVEIHAEATSEKVAMGHHLDGRAALVFGTHTHVPTADAKVLPGGTAYITDLGMTGPYDSVLGRRKDRVLASMTTNMPHAFDVATGDARLCGAVAEVDERTGRATSIERIEVPLGDFVGED